MEFCDVHQKSVAEMFHDPFCAEILNKLESELSENFIYHSVNHTKDVISEALLFALLDGISGRDLQILATAAAFHDAGYMVRYYGHEEESVKIFIETKEKYPTFFSNTEVSTIIAMILDTKINEDVSKPLHTCTMPLSKYLVDGDMSNLGRDDFYQKSNLVMEEVRAVTQCEIPEKDFLNSVQMLLLHHQWYSDSAKRLREEGKARNLHAIKLFRIF
ncbi:MAG: hypothetical protein ACOX2O_00010 [Bdellovibrionota bacterium]|jgi:hypothetical protein